MWRRSRNAHNYNQLNELHNNVELCVPSGESLKVGALALLRSGQEVAMDTNHESGELTLPSGGGRHIPGEGPHRLHRW